MNRIFKAIDKVEESLGHSPHPPMTDLPIGAWAVSGISNVMGMATGGGVLALREPHSERERNLARR